MLSQDTLHQDARAVAIEAASRIVADTDLSAYGHSNTATRDKTRTQATLTMADEFYRFIIFGDKQVS